MKLSSLLILIPLLLLLNTANAGGVHPLPNCFALNKYYRNKLLPLIGPYGARSDNAYIRGRYISSDDDVDDDSPGGPADLRIRPFGEAKRVKFSNVSDNWQTYEDEDEDDDDDVPDFSGTNVQIKGVDEPDIIKTDGKRVFTLSGTKLSVVRVEDMGKGGTRVGSLVLPLYPRDMLIHNDWLIVIAFDYRYKRRVYNRYEDDESRHTATVLYQINVSKAKPKLVSTLHLEGSYVQAREVEGNMRIVMRFNPLDSIWLWRAGRGISEKQSEEWNKEIIRSSQPGNWLPTYRLKYLKGVRRGVYTLCNEVWVDRTKFSGFDLLSVVTLDIEKLMMPNSGAAIVSDAEKVFSTRTTMYVTTSEFRYGDVDDSDDRWGYNYETSIHKFAITTEGAKFEATGEVTGSLINQFAMGERDGVLFMATTDGATWWTGRNPSESKVSAFETDKGTRRLVKIGEVGELGRTERIYSVRFRGNSAYVVTFRETDPLYIVDTTDPRDMKVLGELKIPGFSSYLHIVAPGRVLGVGQEATLSGRTTGVKLSLFDVSDRTNPLEVSTWTLRGTYSSVSWDHRAFLYWQKEKVAIMPVSGYFDRAYFAGAIVFNINDKTIRERGRIEHRDWRSRGTWSIMRNAIIGDNVWSMSSRFLQVNDLSALGTVQDKIRID